MASRWELMCLALLARSLKTSAESQASPVKDIFSIIWHISGLDPAGPLFEGYSPKVRLDKSDANYVDVIHSNGDSLIIGGLGSWEPIGHVDFYPNGGRAQRGCQNLLIGGLYDFIYCKKLAVEFFPPITGLFQPIAPKMKATDTFAITGELTSYSQIQSRLSANSQPSPVTHMRNLKVGSALHATQRWVSWVATKRCNEFRWRSESAGN